MPKILSFETDDSALHDLALVLAQTGAAVSSVNQKSEALRVTQSVAPDLLIVGPNVVDSLRGWITRTIKSLNPQLKVVYLCDGAIVGAEAADAVLSSECISEHLVSTVQHLLEPGRNMLITA